MTNASINNALYTHNFANSQVLSAINESRIDTNFLKIESNLKALEDMWSNLSNWKIYKSDRTWEW